MVVALPPDASIVALERRGLLESTPRGWRLASGARGAFQRGNESADPRGDADHLAHALVSQPDPVPALEGLRLLATQHRTDDVLRTLEKRGPALLASGYAADVWRALSPCSDDPRLARWRLRCTAEFDNPGVLAAVAEQRDGAPDDRLAWAHVLFRRGRIDAAETAARDALHAAQTAGDHVTALDAAILRTRAIAQQGRENEALASLDAIQPRDVPARARVDALAAMLHTALDQRDAARERIARLRTQLTSLPPAVQLEVGFGIVQALYFLGEYRDADEAIHDLVARAGETALALSHGRRLLYYRASVAIERGRLADAQELLARLQAFADGRSMFRAFVDFAEAALCLAQGRFERLDEIVPRVVTAGSALGEWNPHHVEALLLANRVAVLTAHASPTPLPDDDVLPTGGGYPARARLAIARFELELRRGNVPSQDAWPRPDELPAWGDTRNLARMARARAALLAGRFDAAIESAESVLQDASDAGSLLSEAEARLLAAEIHLVRGDAAEVLRSARSIAAFARMAPSPRCLAESEWFESCGLGNGPDGAALERLAATCESVAPVVARRARAMLGGDDASLDALDRVIVGSVRRAWGARAIAPVRATPGRTDPWRPGWGLDVPNQSVWLPGGGETVSFRERALLFRVLVALAERGGEATKEALAVAVWNEREYHPLRHDNRLRLAVRKIRQVIEPDAKEPELLATTEDGYRLGGVARWVRGA
jgi:tetratricopeptide (TPR) repeat protein